MGVMVKVACRKCRAEWTCRTGCGILHGNLETAARLYPEDVRQEIMEYAGRMEFPVYDFNYQLAYCRQCNAIVSVPVLAFGSGHREYAGTCAQCGSKAELAEDVERMPCPACHEVSLEKENTGLWD